MLSLFDILGCIVMTSAGTAASSAYPTPRIPTRHHQGTLSFAGYHIRHTESSACLLRIARVTIRLTSGGACGFKGSGREPLCRMLWMKMREKPRCSNGVKS